MSQKEINSSMYIVHILNMMDIIIHNCYVNKIHTPIDVHKSGQLCALFYEVKIQFTIVHVLNKYSIKQIRSSKARKSDIMVKS